MNIAENDDQSSFCPEPLKHVDNDDVIIVFDSYDGLLMSGNSSSCFGGHNREHQFIHLVTYIYAPPSTGLRVIFEVSGLACMESGLIVYHELYTKKQDSIPYQQCDLINSENLANAMRRCEFFCDNVQNIASAAKVHVQVQWLPWVVGMDFETCNLSVGSEDWVPNRWHGMKRRTIKLSTLPL